MQILDTAICMAIPFLFGLLLKCVEQVGPTPSLLHGPLCLSLYS